MKSHDHDDDDDDDDREWKKMQQRKKEKQKKMYTHKFCVYSEGLSVWCNLFLLLYLPFSSTFKNYKAVLYTQEELSRGME
jgi:hypothetical protein